MEAKRRYDLDWIRVLVFDILILYHIGMFFVPWLWLIKNNEIIEWLTIPMVFVNRWRLSILFVISGIGTRFALSRRSERTFAVERIQRLLIPLVGGIVLVVAPQMYYAYIFRGGSVSSYLEFYIWFISFGSIKEYGLSSFWSHLWFLPYLLLMSLISIPIFFYLRKEQNVLVLAYRRLLSKYPLALYIFVIPMFFIEAYLEPYYPLTLNLYDDVYYFSLYYLCFLSGFFLISTGDAFWQALTSIKYVALLIGLISFPTLVWLWHNYPTFWVSVFASLNRWSWILVIFAFSSMYLNKGSRLLQYRNQAVYPFYILHQTITVIIGYYLIDIQILNTYKFLILLIGTYVGCWLLYEFIIRPSNLLRLLFGVKSISKK